MKAICSLLAVALAQGSVVPVSRTGLSLELHSVLSSLSPISSLASLSIAWDKQYHFHRLGLDVKVAYVSPNSVEDGVLVRVSWTAPTLLTPFHWCVTSLNMDVVMQTKLNSDNAGIKVGYQAVVHGSPTQGTASLTRKAGLGKVTTSMLLTQGGTTSLQVGLETHSNNKLTLSTNIQGKTFDLGINRIRGNSYILTFPTNLGQGSTTLVVTPSPQEKKIDILLSCLHDKTVNHKAQILYNPISTEWGLYITGDFEGPVEFRLVLAKDFKFAHAIVSYNGVNYVHAKIEGRMTGREPLTSLLKYTVSYDINQGKWGEGTAKVVYNGLGETRVLSASLVPKTGHALDFSLKAQVDADWCMEISHELLSNKQVIYTMAHKTEVVENTATKFQATHTDKASIPTSSPAYKLTQGTYLGDILQNMKRKMVVAIDWTTKNGNIYGIQFKDSLLTAGKSHFNILLDTTTTPYLFSVYYPVGPQVWGVNLGLRNLLSQDKVGCEITHAPGKQVVIKTDVDSISVDVILPNLNSTPVFAVKVTHCETNDKAVDWVLHRAGPVYKLSLLTHVHTPTTPHICAPAKGCTWTGNLNFEVDLATRLSGLLPAHSLAATLTRNTESLLEVMHTHTRHSSPIFYSLTCPLALPTPLHLSIDYHEGRGMTIAVPDYLPVDIVVETEGTRHTIVLEGNHVAVLEINMPMKQIDFELPLAETPLLVISWTQADLRSNLVTAGATLPLLHKGARLEMSWDLRNPTDITASAFLKSDLPLLSALGVHVSHNCALATATSVSLAINGETVDISF